MTKSLPNTPGPLGYLVALVVTFTLYGPITMLPELLGGDLAGFLGWSLLLSAVSAAYAGPVALLGAGAVHLCCRRIPSQLVHVIAAGIAGFVVAALVGLLLLDIPPYDRLIAAAAVAAALGREAAVPFVEARRRRLAAASTPVDRDWLPTPRSGYPDPSPAPDEGR